MPRFYKIAAVIASLLGIWLLTEIILTVRETRATIVQVRKDEDEVKRNLNGTLIQLGLVLDNIRQMAETQQETARATAKNTERLTREAADTFAKLNTTIDRVNNETLPQISKTLETANLQIQNTGEEAAQTLAVTRKGLDATLAETTRTMAELHVVINDPSIKRSLQNIEAATKESVEGIKQVKGVAEDTHEMTTDLKKAVKRATKPVPWIFSGLAWGWKRVVEIFQAKAGGL